MLLIMVATVLTAAFCPVQGQEQPRYGGTFICNTPADPVILCPILAGDTYSHNIAGQIFTQLVKYDENFALQGDLAESWTFSNDGLTYTFKIRRGVKWHDGVPFTSKDVKFTYDTITSKKLVASGNFKIVDRIDCPDDYTVVIRLKSPNAAFLSALTGYSLGCSQIIPEHLYAGTDIQTNPHNYKPIGTGPYKFVEWVKGSHVTLEANKDYYGGGPYIGKLIYKIIPDISTALIALEAGEIHYMGAPPPTEIPRLKTLKGIGVYMQPGNDILYMAVNLAHPRSPLTNKKVRQALYTAINRKSIVDNIVIYAVPSTSCYTKAQAAYYDPKVAEMYPVEGDIAKANRMLDEAGYPRDASGKRFSVSIWTRVGATDREDACMAVKQWWKQLGVDATVQTIEFTTLQNSFWNERDYECVVWSSGMGPDPDIAYTRLHSSEIYRGGKNAYSFKNSRIDELLDLGRRNPDPKMRAVYYSEIQRIVMDELPFMPLWEGSAIHVWNREFEGLPNLPIPFQYPLNRVWWSKGFSPKTISDAKAAIDKAEGEGRTYGLEEARKLYQQAQKAFEAMDYSTAATLAGQATAAANSAKSFLQIYGTSILGAIIVILIILSAVAYKRRKK